MAKKPFRLSNGPIQPSMVAPQVAARLRTNGAYIVDTSIAEIGTFQADNWGHIQMPVGRYTYRQWGIMLAAPAAIAGVTDLRGGLNIVRTAKVADYLAWIQIEINGKTEWELRTPELVKMNAYHNIDTQEGVLRIQFGAPGLFNDDLAEDAYQLGTANLRLLKLKMKTTGAWVSGMRPIIIAEYAPVARPIGYFQTTTRYGYTAPGAGSFSITDLAVGIDWAQIWVQSSAAAITDAVLTVDRTTVFDGDLWSLQAVNSAFGKDVAALGNGLMFDAFRDGDAIGFDSVADQRAERARGADVRLDLEMSAAGVALDVVIFHCGLFADQ